MPAKKPQPTELVTWMCTRCLQEMIYPNDKKKIVCGLCKKGDCMNIVAREPLTPQSMEAAMMKSVEKMIASLQKAYDTQPEKTDDEEILLLEAMVKAKNLEKGIQKAFGKSSKKRGGVHHVEIAL